MIIEFNWRTVDWTRLKNFLETRGYLYASISNEPIYNLYGAEYLYKKRNPASNTFWGYVASPERLALKFNPADQVDKIIVETMLNFG